MRKGIDLDHVRRVFEQTRACGIPSLAYFMIGNPEERRSDVEETFAFMRKLDPDYVHITILTPFPGTAVYEDGLRRGLLGGDEWDMFAKRPTADFHPPYWKEFFARDELEELLTKGYKSFCLRPTYVARRALRVRSIAEIKRKARAGLRVLAMKGASGRRSSGDSSIPAGATALPEKPGPAPRPGTDSGPTGGGIPGDLDGLLSMHLLRRRMDIVQPFLRRGKRILDLGCGVFRWQGRIPSGADYVGVDREVCVIQHNRAHTPYKFVLADIEQDDLSACGDQFDIVLLLATLEHFRDPRGVLDKVAQLLTADGIIILTTPHPAGDVVLRAGAHMGIFARDKQQHHSLLDQHELGRLAADTHLEVTTYKRFQAGFNQLVILRRAVDHEPVPA
jgi:2-polyprenyl-3-methyl-5-hydroxy-6-metoxy-1,4-benzoquinol methylase